MPGNSPDSGKITRVRWSISKGPLTTIHQIWGKIKEQEDPSPRVEARQFTKVGQNRKSKMIHIEGSTRNNSPDSGEIQ
eukprot:scaffold2630_cov80-Cylindrotheca_fusiformis.AAC.1